MYSEYFNFGRDLRRILNKREGMLIFQKFEGKQSNLLIFLIISFFFFFLNQKLFPFFETTNRRRVVVWAFLRHVRFPTIGPAVVNWAAINIFI